MRTIASIITLLVLTLGLAGCGGSSGCGSLSGGGGTGTGTTASCNTTTTTQTKVASLTVSSSAASVPSDGSTTATVTVLAKDANNNALSGVSITLSASGGTLTPAATTTDKTGTITATLSASGVKAGSTITVTAASGSVSGQATVSVVSTQQNLSLLASSPQLHSDNSKAVTITALVQDANNKLLTGVPVTFQASSGAIAAIQTTAGAAATPQVAAGTTDLNGVAAANLSTPGNPANRTITVTATAGSATATIQVQVVGTSISVTGPNTLVQGAQGPYGLTVTDFGGNGIPNVPVTLTSANGNTITPSTVTTGTTGTGTFNMTAVNSGADTITATWQSATGTEKVSVSSQNFTITAPVSGAKPVVGQSQPVTISWTNGGAPANGTVELTTSRGTLTGTSSPVSGGAMTSAINLSSTTAGNAIISATALDNTNTVVATAQTSISFIATTPNAISVQASPSTVALKSQSTLTATVTDPTGNPVANAMVDFTLTDSTGGQLSTGQAQTNDLGQASVTYTSSNLSSKPNGVVVTVAVLSNPSITSSTTLTVGGQTVFLSLGTGNTITSLNATQYELPYTVQAVDAAGNGVGNVNVTFSVQSVAYAQGSMPFFHTATNTWLPPTYTTVTTNYVEKGFCPPATVNEYNGVINPTPPPTGVTPVVTNIPGSVASTDIGNALTSSSGSAAVNLIYPKDHAYWVIVALTATATVSGTQSSTTASFVLPGAAGDYGQAGTAPPGQISPYGQSTTCY